MPRVDVAQLLAAWRSAERQLGELIEASPMRTLVRAEVARLRADYHRVFEDRRRSFAQDRAGPPSD